MSDYDGLERRQVLSGLGAGLLTTGLGVGQTSGENHDVTVTLNNQGASAWVLDSAGENVGETGEPNPALTLTVGTRYRFENLGWSFHPLAFRDADDNALLTQSAYGTGSFEDDSAVNWVDNGEELAFTVTESLAAEFDDYVCTVHPSMEGALGAQAPQEAPFFEVGSPSPQSAVVTSGETIELSATVENTGDVEATQAIGLEVNGLGEIASESQTLSGGIANEVSFLVDTTDIEPGEYTYTFVSDDDEASGSLTVESSMDPVASFEVSNLSPADGTVEQGVTVTAEATVQNTGEEEGTQSVTFSVVGTDISVSQTVSLAGGESTTTSFDLDTADVPVGEYTHRVESEDSSVTGALTVQEPPEPAAFQLSGLDPTTASVTQGEELVVTASVQNTGDEEATQDIVLTLSELGEVASDSLTLAGGGSDSVSFTVDTTDVPAGEYTHTVSTDDGTSEGSLTVLAQTPEDDSADGTGDDSGGDDSSVDDSTDGTGGDDPTNGGDNTTGDENNTDGADGSGPGFGPLAGLTALGGLTAYAARRLGVADDTGD